MTTPQPTPLTQHTALLNKIDAVIASGEASYHIAALNRALEQSPADSSPSIPQFNMASLAKLRQTLAGNAPLDPSTASQAIFLQHYFGIDHYTPVSSSLIKKMQSSVGNVTRLMALFTQDPLAQLRTALLTKAASEATTQSPGSEQRTSPQALTRPPSPEPAARPTPATPTTRPLPWLPPAELTPAELQRDLKAMVNLVEQLHQTNTQHMIEAHQTLYPIPVLGAAIAHTSYASNHPQALFKDEDFCREYYKTLIFIENNLPLPAYTDEVHELFTRWSLTSLAHPAEAKEAELQTKNLPPTQAEVAQAYQKLCILKDRLNDSEEFASLREEIEGHLTSIETWYAKNKSASLPVSQPANFEAALKIVQEWGQKNLLLNPAQSPLPRNPRQEITFLLETLALFTNSLNPHNAKLVNILMVKGGALENSPEEVEALLQVLKSQVREAKSRWMRRGLKRQQIHEWPNWLKQNANLVTLALITTEHGTHPTAQTILDSIQDHISPHWLSVLEPIHRSILGLEFYGVQEKLKNQGFSLEPSSKSEGRHPAFELYRRRADLRQAFKLAHMTQTQALQSLADLHQDFPYVLIPDINLVSNSRGTTETPPPAPESATELVSADLILSKALYARLERINEQKRKNIQAIYKRYSDLRGHGSRDDPEKKNQHALQFLQALYEYSRADLEMEAENIASAEAWIEKLKNKEYAIIIENRLLKQGLYIPRVTPSSPRLPLIAHRASQAIQVAHTTTGSGIASSAEVFQDPNHSSPLSRERAAPDKESARFEREPQEEDRNKDRHATTSDKEAAKPFSNSTGPLTRGRK